MQILSKMCGRTKIKLEGNPLHTQMQFEKANFYEFQYDIYYLTKIFFETSRERVMSKSTIKVSKLLGKLFSNL